MEIKRSFSINLSPEHAIPNIELALREIGLVVSRANYHDGSVLAKQQWWEEGGSPIFNVSVTPDYGQSVITVTCGSEEIFNKFYKKLMILTS